MKYICIYDARKIQAEEFANQLYNVYGWEVFSNTEFTNTQSDENTIFITLGGDGLLLHITHLLEKNKIPPKIYPINYGTIGFLTNNKTHAIHLKHKIDESVTSFLKFLEIELLHTNGTKTTEYALNDVSILRQTGQAVHIKISINDITRIEELVADGLVISTPAGSTAYNFSTGGPIFSVNSGLLSIQPVSPFRPRHWRGALVNDQCNIEVEMLQVYKRPTSVNIDSKHYENIEKIRVTLCHNKGIQLLFDKNLTLEEKILSEQFTI